MYLPRHQKIYLSRAMTRAMALEHPIGDPHGGPAYGERNEPVSAIIAVGTMFATGGAMMAGSLMAGLAFAGAAISLVGNISGNSTLSKIGMVAGLVGGAGMAGMFGEAAAGATWGSAFGGAEAAGAAAGGAPGAALAQTPTADLAVMQDFPAAGLESAAGAAPVPTAEGLINSAISTPVNVNTLPVETPLGPLNRGMSPTPDIGYAMGGADAAPAALGAPNAPMAPTAAAPTAPTASAAAAPTAPVAPVAGGDQVMMGMLEGGTTPGVMTPPAGAAPAAAQTAGNSLWQGVKDAGGSLLKLAKDSPAAALMLGQVATSAGDYLSGKTQAQIDQMVASGELSKAQADKIRYEMELNEKRRRQLNSNQGVPLTMQINPTGAQFGSQNGLISGARTGG